MAELANERYQSSTLRHINCDDIGRTIGDGKSVGVPLS